MCTKTDIYACIYIYCFCFLLYTCDYFNYDKNYM